MAKGYWIANVEVHDPEGYAAYRDANAAPLAEYGGTFLVRAGAHEVAEGTSRSRVVVIEFPSYQAAKDCYYSDGYQAARAKRAHASEGDLVIVEGYDL